MRSVTHEGLVAPDYERFAVDKFLAAAVLASIPIGSVISFGMTGRGANIALAQLLTLVLALHLIFSKLASPRHYKSGLGFAISFVLLMAPAFVIAPDMAPAAVAYFNYATGVVGGVTIGICWARSRFDRMGIVDAGLVLFLVVGAAQLVQGFLGASSINSLHQNAQTPWGNSNYVAACLVVGAFLLLARGMETGSVRLVVMPFLGVVIVALLTLSRGAAISLAVGVAILLWTAGSRSWQRVALRLISVALPFFALYLITALEKVRYQGSRHSSSNIDSRIKLFGAAWEDFLGAPWVGNGWVSFRSVSANAVEEQSFAHNFFLSFLQIGGITFGLATVVAILVVMIRAVRRRPHIAPTLCAAFAISMSDPFFESTSANLITFAAIFSTTLSRAPLASGQGLGPHAARRTYLPKSV